MVERATVELELCELIIREAIRVGNEEIDLILSRVDPLDVAIAIFIVLKALVRLSVPLQPVTIGQDALWLEDFLTMARHVDRHRIFGEVCLRAHCLRPLILGHHGLDIGVLDHARCDFEVQRLTDVLNHWPLGWLLDAWLLHLHSSLHLLHQRRKEFHLERFSVFFFSLLTVF